MTINEALKQTYVRAGGVEDLESIERKVEILNAISELFGGKSDAVSVAQAIENISEVVQSPTLIEKTVTTNGEYSASDDDATGYSKVKVNVQSENNAQFVGNQSTFYFNTNIKSIVFPDGVTTISNNLCFNASDLTSVVLPNGLTAINNQAFMYCSSLPSIELPNSLTSIASSVFKGCTALTAITIPNSVETIGSACFAECTALETITINKPEGSIEGAPWGAPNATVIWTG